MLTRSTLLLICGALVACSEQGPETPATTEAPTPPAANVAAPAAPPSTPGLARKPAPAGAVQPVG